MKILCIADKPGWCIDNITDQISQNLPEYEWERIFFRNCYTNEIAEAISRSEIIWIANSGIEKCIPVSLLSNKKVIYSFHSFYFNHSDVEFAKKCSATIVPSRTLFYHLSEHIEKLHIVPNGVSDFFKPYKEVRIGAVGNEDDPAKGIQITQEACQRLGFRCKIAGFETHGNKKDPQSGYKISPDCNYTDMPVWYEQIDCLVVMSESEGFGLPIIEAMKMNVPVITTDVGVARELDCILCARNVDALCTWLKRLFGRKQVERYTWKKSAKEFRKVVENIR